MPDAKCCPYGCSAVAPCILALIAAWGVNAATWGCWYFQKTVDLSTAGFGNKDRGYGPWTVEEFKLEFSFASTTLTTGECVGWYDEWSPPTKFFDASYRFGRAATLIAWILGVIPWIAFLFTGCCVFPDSCLKMLMPSWGIAAIFSILSLVILGSDYYKKDFPTILLLPGPALNQQLIGSGQTLSGGFVGAILGFIFFIAAAIAIPCMKANEDDGGDDRGAPVGEEKTEITEKVIEEDGKTVKIITKTVTAADGSKTVTETREEVETAPAEAEAEVEVEGEK